jgi:hypothetical protein
MAANYHLVLLVQFITLLALTAQGYAQSFTWYCSAFCMMSGDPGGSLVGFDNHKPGDNLLVGLCNNPSAGAYTWTYLDLTKVLFWNEQTSAIEF